MTTLKVVRSLPGLCLLVALAFPVLAQQPGAATTSVSSVDPEAVAALGKMGSALRALPQFKLEANTSTDYVLDDGQVVTLDGTVTYKVQQPNHFNVEIKSEKQHQQFVYDGNTLSINSPRLKLFTQVEQVNKSTKELLVSAMQEYGIEFPLAELFLWGTPQFATDQLTSAVSLGPVTIAGERTDHYAFRQPGADWQVWVSQATSLPAKLSIVSQYDPALPAYVAQLKWNTNSQVSSRDFAFTPPAGSTKIVFTPATLAAGADNNKVK